MALSAGLPDGLMKFLDSYPFGSAPDIFATKYISLPTGNLNMPPRLFIYIFKEKIIFS